MRRTEGRAAHPFTFIDTAPPPWLDAADMKSNSLYAACTDSWKAKRLQRIRWSRL